ncbi:MAG: sulfatase-like hydrolase/transferase [Bacteroidia bacterium]|nr:sulfatase-like hydrolase/transferase [Bacteroidia bacterium]
MSYLVKYSYLLLFFPIFLFWGITAQNSIEAIMPERLIFLHALLYSLAFFLPKKILKAGYIITIYLVTFLLIFFETAYIYLYKEELTSSIVFILLETNITESTEYLKVYFTTPIIKLLLQFLIPSILILWLVIKALYKYSLDSYLQDLKDLISVVKSIFTKQQSTAPVRLHEKTTTQSSLYRWIIALLITCTGTIIYVEAGHFQHHIISKFLNGYKLYEEEINKYKDYMVNSNKSPYISSVIPQSKDKPRTLIIIIGESTTKHHMEIYGYYRNTTPNLKKIENQLVLFNDVISPHTHTIAALEKSLTFGTNAHPEEKEKGSMIQLVKAAGYKTFWISNQNPIGLYETLVTMIGRTADQSYFINTGSNDQQKSYYKESYDERLFPFIEKALQDSEPLKVIFVHLYGTHAAYSGRYPKEYAYFKDSAHTDYPSERALDAINMYDNAVRYNDFIVSHIISLTQKNSKNGEEQQVIYYSDHGEDVYQSMNFEGHTESVGSFPMFEIPFIYWSNQQNKVQTYAQYKNRSYMTDELIYSVADLLDIKFNGRDDHKSIFSTSFQPEPRIVKGSINYDKEIKP